VYGSGTKFKLPVDPVHSTGIRLATGTFLTGRVGSLYMESSEPPLSLRGDLLHDYAAKSATLPKPPTCAAVFVSSHPRDRCELLA
jgi:hypothetical protein